MFSYIVTSKMLCLVVTNISFWFLFAVEGQEFWPFQDFQGPQPKFKEFPGPGIFFCQFQDFPGFSSTVTTLYVEIINDYVDVFEPWQTACWPNLLNVITSNQQYSITKTMINRINPTQKQFDQPCQPFALNMSLHCIQSQLQVWPTKVQCGRPWLVRSSITWRSAAEVVFYGKCYSGTYLLII